MTLKYTRLTFCFLFLLLAVPPVHADMADSIETSFELQVYPTGIIPGIRFEKGFKNKHAVHFRLGYQEIRHEDYGVHDDERGDGFGFSFGYRYYLRNNFLGWSFGLRTDLWRNKLDWQDNIGQPDQAEGTTTVIVVQPTVQIAHTFSANSDLIIIPSLAFGFEVNVDTDGEDVGEGSIWLVGIELGKRF